ncbi:uncharacterized protein RCH25_044023 [Pelodytes ibericus]
MALHHQLKVWQRILLGILCFPILPFYLCYLCLKKDGKGKELEDGRIEASLSNDEEENRQNDVKIQKDENDHRKSRTKEKDKSAPTEYPWERFNLKSIQVDLKAFQKLDTYASKTNASWTLETLVKDLIRDTSTDLEKTRVIWIWICHHIEHDTAAMKNKALQSSDSEVIFRTRKGSCSGYSSLLMDMCSIAGVQCKSVSGYSKGAGYKVGQRISGEADHAWNMVHLEGGWHLLDSTLGAGHVDDNTSKFTFQYNEFFFLTHPVLFIEDHFPEDADCQLVEPLLSLKQFELRVHHRSHFYSLGLKSSQPDTAVIETVKGNVSITIENRQHMLFLFHLNDTEEPGLMRFMGYKPIFDVYPQKTGHHVLQIFCKSPGLAGVYHLVLDYMIDCKTVDTTMKIPKCLQNPAGPGWFSEKAGLLQPSHTNPVIHTEDGSCTVSFVLDRVFKLSSILKSDELKNIRNHVIQRVQGCKVEFNIQLPHCGFYVLHIYGEVTGYICNYLIICSNFKVKWPPLPVFLQNPVGPNPETEKAGLHPSHPDPVIHTEDGCCKISFRLNRAQKLTAKLNIGFRVVQNQIIQKTQKDKVEFHIRLPSSGAFVLQIFNDSIGYICNYLLSCSNPNVNWPSFPTHLLNPVGPNPETENFGLLQPSHPDPVIDLEDGCCTISFELDRVLILTASLKSDEIQTMPNHILQSIQKHRVEFKVRLPQAGSYVFQIFDGFSCVVCNYLLRCTSPKVNWPPYPSGLPNPVGPNTETERAGLLEPSHPGPIINTQDGCCAVSFTVKRDLIFFCTLQSEDSQMTSEMKHRHVFHTQKEEKVEFKVRLPRSGTYILRVNVEAKNSRGYTCQCNYLIVCSNPSVHWPVFPLIYEKWDKLYDLVEPLDGVLPKNSDVSFKLLVPGVIGVSVKGKGSFPLTLNDQGYWEGTCSTADCKEIYVTVLYEEQPNTLVYILQYQVQ